MNLVPVVTTWGILEHASKSDGMAAREKFLGRRHVMERRSSGRPRSAGETRKHLATEPISSPQSLGTVRLVVWRWLTTLGANLVGPALA